jgi:hypothetical protein
MGTAGRRPARPPGPPAARAPGSPPRRVPESRPGRGPGSRPGCGPGSRPGCGPGSRPGRGPGSPTPRTAARDGRVLSLMALTCLLGKHPRSPPTDRPARALVPAPSGPNGPVSLIINHSSRIPVVFPGDMPGMWSRSEWEVEGWVGGARAGELGRVWGLGGRGVGAGAGVGGAGPIRGRGWGLGGPGVGPGPGVVAGWPGWGLGGRRRARWPEAGWGGPRAGSWGLSVDRGDERCILVIIRF